mmetsp:Transcript_48490/g.80376  ORF Transcript_48490/g.80376 Transcript_48490/m.80376 type:complete len:306 (-) Transcript_48490:1048-1965(-)
MNAFLSSPFLLLLLLALLLGGFLLLLLLISLILFIVRLLRIEKRGTNILLRIPVHIRIRIHLLIIHMHQTRKLVVKNGFLDNLLHLLAPRTLKRVFVLVVQLVQRVQHREAKLPQSEARLESAWSSRPKKHMLIAGNAQLAPIAHARNHLLQMQFLAQRQQLIAAACCCCCRITLLQLHIFFDLRQAMMHILKVRGVRRQRSHTDPQIAQRAIDIAAFRHDAKDIEDFVAHFRHTNAFRTHAKHQEVATIVVVAQQQAEQHKIQRVIVHADLRQSRMLAIFILTRRFGLLLLLLLFLLFLLFLLR